VDSRRPIHRLGNCLFKNVVKNIFLLEYFPVTVVGPVRLFIGEGPVFLCKVILSGSRTKTAKGYGSFF
jgi:hypothetical protein